jgi:hypothetical protein
MSHYPVGYGHDWGFGYEIPPDVSLYNRILSDGCGGGAGYSLTIDVCSGSGNGLSYGKDGDYFCGQETACIRTRRRT